MARPRSGLGVVAGEQHRTQAEGAQSREPDHLTTLLSLYASLGEAAEEAARTVTADALSQLRQALFWEYLWPWLPATAGWLAEEAARWSRRHIEVAFGDPVWQWWAARAGTTARVLRRGRAVSAPD
jgi:hypothetical protein